MTTFRSRNWRAFWGQIELAPSEICQKKRRARKMLGHKQAQNGGMRGCTLLPGGVSIPNPGMSAWRRVPTRIAHVGYAAKAKTSASSNSYKIFTRTRTGGHAMDFAMIQPQPPDIDARWGPVRGL